MFKYLEAYFLEVIKGKKKGFFASCLKAILYLLSWVYRGIVACRNFAYDHGWLRQYYPPVPVVISIGNIVAGGTGKTPVTLMISEELYEDYQIAILSRGYRSEAEKLSIPIVLSKGNGPMHPAIYCGDEPFLLSQNLPKALVFVGKNRHKSSKMAAKAGAEVILLDDGMQHRQLARDLDVVVVDVSDPFGGGYFIPRGVLRESIKSLSRADLIILNHVRDYEGFKKVQQIVSSYSSAPVVGTRMEVRQIWDFRGNPIYDIKSKKVGLFCAIANPESFKETILGLGAEIVDCLVEPDHKPFHVEDLKVFADKCLKQGAEMLLCTEKDRVKLELSVFTPYPFGWVQMQLKIVEGEKEWSDFIGKIRHNLRVSL